MAECLNYYYILKRINGVKEPSTGMYPSIVLFRLVMYYDLMIQISASFAFHCDVHDSWCELKQTFLFVLFIRVFYQEIQFEKRK